MKYRVLNLFPHSRPLNRGELLDGEKISNLEMRIKKGYVEPAGKEENPQLPQLTETKPETVSAPDVPASSVETAPEIPEPPKQPEAAKPKASGKAKK